MARATGETVWWSLFAAGGMIIALLIPALIAVTGIAIPFVESGAIPGLRFSGYGAIVPLISSWLGRLVLFLALSLPFFHCAHRIVHTSKDLGLRNIHGAIAVLFYTAAVVGTVLAFYVIFLM